VPAGVGLVPSSLQTESHLEAGLTAAPGQTVTALGDKVVMRHPGLVAAAIAAATALSSKQGREMLESKLQPLFMPAASVASVEEDNELTSLPLSSRRARR
jgi:hypothetical protein